VAAVVAASVVLLFAASSAFAMGSNTVGGGAGGVIVGSQTSEYPYLEDYRVENNNLGLSYIGGFGYGVSPRGAISGGFGMGLVDPHDEEDGVRAGFGGGIGGWRLLRRPVYLTLTSWTGVGGVSLPAAGRIGGEDSYFAVFQELSLELGIPFVPWFTPTVYAGYQFIGNVIPGRLFSDFVSYTPVVGVRIGWGSF
jgi:hypothetical protein